MGSDLGSGRSNVRISHVHAPLPPPQPKTKEKDAYMGPWALAAVERGGGRFVPWLLPFFGLGGGLNVLLCNPEKDGIGVWIFNHHSLVVKELIS